MPIVEDSKDSRPGIVIGLAVKIALGVVITGVIGVASFQALDKQAASKFYSGDYAGAVEPMEKALIQAKKELGENDPEYANALKNMARVHDANKDYAKAEPLHQESLALYKRVLGVHHLDYAAELSFFGDHRMSMGDYPAAEKAYKESLSIYKENNPKSIENAWVYKRLGGVYHATNRDTEWKAAYTEASKIEFPNGWVDYTKSK
jgi:tetratricopeptide (TPR) repeat protein